MQLPSVTGATISIILPCEKSATLYFCSITLVVQKLPAVFITKRGGTVVTCAATSGYMLEFDNRHLWMKLKRIVSSHFANYQEAYSMNRLISQGKIQPVLSKTYSLDDTGEAANAVHKNEAEGKLGVLCLAPEAGLGISDPDKRERIGEDKITLFQRHARGKL